MFRRNPKELNATATKLATTKITGYRNIARRTHPTTHAPITTTSEEMIECTTDPTAYA